MANTLNCACEWGLPAVCSAGAPRRNAGIPFPSISIHAFLVLALVAFALHIHPRPPALAFTVSRRARIIHRPSSYLPPRDRATSIPTLAKEIRTAIPAPLHTQIGHKKSTAPLNNSALRGRTWGARS
ncbi:hypothetical protein B0H16DRAFT_1744776 [Mycena metata]|uniref:Uncharacterized protein n=1 Tax=Mycena metata TaxID=1033252 RepID=A0AAD7H4P3_9AGAR|nr:hypothetical protein B0H16DRAFT_1744776 [Mycena metata]